MVKKKARKEIDPAWEHCTRVGDSRMKLCCNYCKGEFWGGVLRMKNHLACTSVDVQQCPQVSEDVKNYFVEYLGRNQPKDVDLELGGVEVDRKLKGSMDAYVIKGQGKGKIEQQTMNQMLKKREPVIRDICRMIYAHALPFNLVKDSFWKRMLVSVGEYGKGLKPPTYHEARVSYLKREVELVKGLVYRKEWKETGCTLMSDAWTDGKHRNITNFLINSPRGTVFVKSIDTSGIIKNSKKLFELLDGLVEEIGEENVVQVVTDSASAYVGADKLLEEKRKSLMWSPCAAHLLDLMLSEIGDIPIFKNTLEKAKIVSGFIYRHQWVLDLFSQFTRKKELTRPAVTRFATAYLTLKSFEETKIGLRAMFRSEEWVKSSYCKQSGAFEAEEIIDRDPKFWPGLKYCMKVVLPLVKLLRLVDGDSKPAVGYIYEAMDRAKEEIAKNVNNMKSRYDKIWQIVDKRWDLQLHRPYHAAAYFLNPRFQYDESFKADMEVKRGLYITLDKFYSDIDTRIKVDAQLEKFKKAEGMFGMSLAIATRDKKQPTLWWESFGEECKELQRLAIRVLSLTCSATGCERNWSTFDQVHTKRRNRLEQQRMNALVFVKYNLRLEERQQKRQERGETYDPICLSYMESDDEWITEKENPCLPEDTSWLDIHECFQDDDEGVSRKRKKRGPRDLNARYRGKKIGDGFLVDEDEVEVEVIEDDEENEEELQEVNMVESDDDDDDDDLDIDVDGEEEY